MQYSTILVAALAATPFVAAHGKVAVVTGDAGGNTTALGIEGAVVPGPGKNAVTEVDTTVFGSTKIATDGLGKTTGGGKNTMAGMASVMEQSGSTLPQVSADGSGTISGTLHVVTTDGAGPYDAVVDPTGTGKFSTGTKAQVVTQVPGKNGNIKADGTVRNKVRSILMKYGVIERRAANVNKDFPFKVAIPAGMTCTGTAGGQSGVCAVKFANSNGAGPFGGVFMIQMAGGEANATGAAAETTGAAKRDFIAKEFSA